jgi:endonuclease VIII
MPEGLSIWTLREVAAAFAGQTIRYAEGNAKIDMQRLPGQRLEAIHSFGKQFLIELPDRLAVRIHLLMFGSYRIDERKDAVPRSGLGFDHGELNFYACSARLLEGDLDELYDWAPT